MSNLEDLIEAAKNGEVERVNEIVAAKPDLARARLPGGESPLMAALYRGQQSVVEALARYGAIDDVFSSAATGSLAELKVALTDATAVARVAYDGWSPLHLAAFFGRLEVAQALIDAGADVRAVSHNTLHNTPLHAAAAGKHVDVARLLLRYGADPDAEDAGGYTARRIAIENKLDLPL